mgnify:CR=1 FL=1
MLPGGIDHHDPCPPAERGQLQLLAARLRNAAEHGFFAKCDDGILALSIATDPRPVTVGVLHMPLVRQL